MGRGLTPRADARKGVSPRASRRFPRLLTDPEWIDLDSVSSHEPACSAFYVFNRQRENRLRWPHRNSFLHVLVRILGRPVAYGFSKEAHRVERHRPHRNQRAAQFLVSPPSHLVTRERNQGNRDWWSLVDLDHMVVEMNRSGGCLHWARKENVGKINRAEQFLQWHSGCSPP